jgi:glycosyltransferase involved in cell wall biosynthesis
MLEAVKTPPDNRQLRLTVTWLPGHPSEGGHSMDRYWRQLVAQSQPFINRGELRTFCPLHIPPLISSRASRFARAWNKYAAYPLRCYGLPPTDVTHLLDHSFAGLLPHLQNRPAVMATLHDLAPLRDPRALTRSQLSRFHTTCLNLRRADLVVCDSSSSAKDALEFLKIPEERLAVLHLGVDFEAFARPVEPLALPEATTDTFRVLSVGSSLPRKNLQSLVPVFLGLKRRGVRTSLLRAGSRLPEELRDQLVRILGRTHLVEFGVLTDDLLVRLYQSSDAFFMPSLIEGFGLPILEAMAAGCPVVSSNACSLPEVAGDAALLFDPAWPEDAVNHLHRIAVDSGARSEFRSKGVSRARSLSWERHFHGLLEHYRALA